MRIGSLCRAVSLLVFTAWLLIANRVPFLEPLAMERNILAAALLTLFACIPLMRFYSLAGRPAGFRAGQPGACWR